MATLSPDQQILQELGALRETVSAMKTVLDSQHKVTMRRVGGQPFLGQPVTMTARVTDMLTDRPRIGVPVTFVATRGRLRTADGFTQQGESVSVKTNVEGVARVTLFSSASEDLLNSQQSALQTILRSLDTEALTPNDTLEGLRSLARAYRWDANLQFRKAVDVYFRANTDRLTNTVNVVDFMRAWSVVEASVVAYAGSADEQDTESVRGFSELTLKFRDWLGPLLQTLLTVTQEDGSLDGDLLGVKTSSADEGALIDGVYGKVKDFVSGQRGILGAYAGGKVAESSVRRFIGSELGDLSADRRVGVFNTLETASHTIGSADPSLVAEISQSRTDTRTNIDTKFGAAITQDAVDARISDAVSGLVDQTGMTSAIQTAVSVATSDNVSQTDMNSAIQGAITDATLNLVDETAMSSAISSAISGARVGTISMAQVTAAIDSAFADPSRNLVTTDGMASAISDATRDLINQDGMSSAIDSAFADPSRNLVTTDGMASAISDATSGFVNQDGMSSAIDSAFADPSRNLVTTDGMASAISSATSGLVNEDGMSSAIDSAFADPSRNLVTADGMASAISSATTNLVTRSSMRRAIDTSIVDATINVIDSKALDTAITEATRSFVDQSAIDNTIEVAFASTEFVTKDQMDTAIIDSRSGLITRRTLDQELALKVDQNTFDTQTTTFEKSLTGLQGDLSDVNVSVTNLDNRLVEVDSSVNLIGNNLLATRTDLTRTIMFGP